MWSLRDFRYDQAIEAEEVLVLDGEAQLMPVGEAIALAHGRGANLVAQWPAVSGEASPPLCIVAKVATPLGWETLPDEDALVIDERLWFEASCGNRDFLLGNAHTFVGRMVAWCPDKQGSYIVSLGEIDEMSEQSRYFIAGFLAGSEPGEPIDDDGNTDDADLMAWRLATRRFRRTGLWYGRWQTCEVCGCVLLPDRFADRCNEHAPVVAD